MSILSEILTTGHVDEELLAALDDDQKQLLFCQMRSEQVRKWEAAEADFEKTGPMNRKQKKKGLRWLTGVDGEVWVWVMGDHEKVSFLKMLKFFDFLENRKIYLKKGQKINQKIQFLSKRKI